MKFSWMLRRALPMLILLAASLTAQAADAPKAAFEFFPLDNGVGRGSWTPEQQAETVKVVGFDGIGYNYTNPADLDKWLTELNKRGMKLYSLYFYTFIDQPNRYPAGLREAIAKLKGQGTTLWMTIRETKDKAKTGYDEQAVAMIREVAGWAQESGLRVAIYPHANFYVATAEEALRVVRKANCPNVGMSINVCHELIAGHGETLLDIVRGAGKDLSLVTVSGANREGKGNADFIKTLDEGDYDVYAFLKTLREIGYTGPVGLQCFSIKGDPNVILRKSMTRWKEYMERLAKEEK